MRQWTEEQRKQQAERIRLHRPWTCSTGPRTLEGKKRCSINAFKHGNRSSAMARIKSCLRRYRVFLRGVRLPVGKLHDMPANKNKKNIEIPTNGLIASPLSALIGYPLQPAFMSPFYGRKAEGRQKLCKSRWDSLKLAHVSTLS